MRRFGNVVKRRFYIMCKVIRLYRHGETEWNRLGKLQGWLDSSLTGEGRQLACEVKWEPDYVVSSDLGRAVETATLMFPQTNFQTDSRLREIYLADWQGQQMSDLVENAYYQLYKQNPGIFQGDKQESFASLAERMLEVLRGVSQLPFKKIAIVSHGVAIASVNAFLQEQSFENIWLYMLGNGEYLEIECTVL